jgi:predicted DNA-binding ArsR family transcriptional regulator
MSKVIINLGYRSVVLDTEKALALVSMLEDAEMYESKYHSAADGKPSYNTHHIYPLTQDNAFSMHLVTNESYNLYKLAGKPEDR